MSVNISQKQISRDEREQIKQQVHADLVEHLYSGCLPGTVTGLIVSGLLFIDYYTYTSTFWLITWLIFFDVTMISLSLLYYAYKKYRVKLSLNFWEKIYSLMMGACSVAWVPAIVLLPDNVSRQFLALMALFLSTTGYATGTIGQFKLCVSTLFIILIPLALWCFHQGGIFYNVIGIYVIIYMVFLMGINLRSTKWFKDSLKLKLENTLVSYQANHDVLTNLPNQRSLPKFIEAAIQESTHSLTQEKKMFAVVCFSLNRTEIITDSYGHEAGNIIVKSVASRLQLLAEQKNRNKSGYQLLITISRKDVFNILVTNVNEEDLQRAMNQLFETLDELIYLENKGIKMTASAGVTLFPTDGETATTLLINADASMLKAKQFGSNHVEYYHKDINAQLPKRIEIESDLHRAIERNEFVAHYQPLVDTDTGRVVSSEALIRWRHPVHGMISPLHFIPIAEETGLIVPIGEWILSEACRQTRIWQKMGFPDLKVAVNFSEKQLKLKNIIEIIARTLKERDYDPNLLEVEITETSVLDEAIISVIKQLKVEGMSLSIDDFGTGYSGLSYFKRFSIDKLKIDQSFIRDIPGNNDSMTIVSAILAMAKELHVKSLAEGVETEDQLKFLRSKGCNFIQGYYFSKPLDAVQFTEYLLHQNHVTTEPTSA